VPVALLLTVLFWPKPLTTGVDWEQVGWIWVEQHRDWLLPPDRLGVPRFGGARTKYELRRTEDEAAFRTVQEGLDAISCRTTPVTFFRTLDQWASNGFWHKSDEVCEITLVIANEQGTAVGMDRIRLYNEGVVQAANDWVYAISDESYQAVAELVASGVLPLTEQVSDRTTA
ncbi:MAG: hypothetical protein IJF59_06400, partial [Clostridia bacterium]|nr:hypothetical protein [Clostridia bacterium]